MSFLHEFEQQQWEASITRSRGNDFPQVRISKRFLDTISLGNLDSIEQYFKKNRKMIDLKTTNESGKTALALAIETNKVDIVKYILGLDSSIVHQRGNYERTVLHNICLMEKPNLEIAGLIIGANVNIFALDQFNYRAADLAFQNNHNELVYLIDCMPQKQRRML